LLFFGTEIEQNPGYEEHRAVLAYTTLGRKYVRLQSAKSSPSEKKELSNKKNSKIFSFNHWTTKAASVALLIGIGCTLFFLSQKSNSLDDETCVAYIYGKKSTDKEVVMQQMEQTLSKFSSGPEIGVEQPLSKMFQDISDVESTNPQ